MICSEHRWLSTAMNQTNVSAFTCPPAETFSKLRKRLGAGVAVKWIARCLNRALLIQCLDLADWPLNKKSPSCYGPIIHSGLPRVERLRTWYKCFGPGMRLVLHVGLPAAGGVVHAGTAGTAPDAPQFDHDATGPGRAD